MVPYISHKSAYEPFIMNTLEKLQCLNSLKGLAILLGYQPKMLSYLLYKLPNDKKYFTFTIPKSNGGIRIINAPNEKLKLLQQKLTKLLYECYAIIRESNKTTLVLSYGFQKNLSIFNNAIKHKNKRYVFNIDLKDFFPSVNFGRVRGYFIKDNNFRLNERIATLIAQIACYNNELPQGAPTSPIISNLIGQILDIRILKLVKKSGVTYSRYADDLTFSTNNRNFPKEIAFQDKTNWVIGNDLRKIIEKSGYIINETKTIMQYKISRQMCVGLIVNRKVNVKKEYYRKVRSMCNNLFKNNKYYITDEDKEKQDNSLSQLNGILNFVYSIKRRYDSRNGSDRHKYPDSITSIYRKFLFYKTFLMTEKPVVFTEGKTDVVYLKCALMNMSEIYPGLIGFNDNKYSFNINIIRTSKIFRDIFSISEGTSGLKNLMEYFVKNIDKYNIATTIFPVIFVIDNDKGSKEIKNYFQLKGEGKLYHECISHKLYVVFISRDNNTVIENLFDKETLEKDINGKIFKLDKKYSDNDHYFGKQIFASKIIRPNYRSIDFTKFKPIFDSISEIINTCNKNLE
jgi:retron-type reverse transcriptase